MNRTLQYFKNIKFNSLFNKTLSNERNKKMAIINIKNKRKNIYQYTQVRKISSNPLSFKTNNFNEPPKPPFDNHLIIISALICGTYFNLKKK